MKTSLKTTLLVCLMAVFFGGYLFFSRGISVNIRNVGGFEIRNVKATVTGESHKKSKLIAGEVWQISVSPQGESGLLLEFESQAGKCKTPSNGYFEPGYHGTIEIELGADSCEPKKWDDHVGVSFKF